MKKAALLAALVLIGCAPSIRPISPEQQIGSSVELGVGSTAAVGDTMYSEFDTMVIQEAYFPTTHI